MAADFCEPGLSSEPNLLALIVPVLPLVVLVGFAIGLTGIGGVLLVPLLVYLTGLLVTDAIAASLAAFVFTGLVGSYAQPREPGTPPAVIAALMMAAGLGSMAGLWTVLRTGHDWPLLLLGLLTTVSGFGALISAPRPKASVPLRLLPSILIGISIGFISALTGTGGPVALTPVLLLMQQPARLITALAQYVQIPIGATASLVAIALGQRSVSLALLLGPSLAVGAIAGVLIRPAIAAAWLERLLSALLVLFGVLTLSSFSLASSPTFVVVDRGLQSRVCAPFHSDPRLQTSNPLTSSAAYNGIHIAAEKTAGGLRPAKR